MAGRAWHPGVRSQPPSTERPSARARFPAPTRLPAARPAAAPGGRVRVRGGRPVAPPTGAAGPASLKDYLALEVPPRPQPDPDRPLTRSFPEARAEEVAQPRVALPSYLPAHRRSSPACHGPAPAGHPWLHQPPLPAAARHTVPRAGQEPAARTTQVSRAQTGMTPEQRSRKQEWPEGAPPPPTPASGPSLGEPPTCCQRLGLNPGPVPQALSHPEQGKRPLCLASPLRAYAHSPLAEQIPQKEREAGGVPRPTHLPHPNGRAEGRVT